MEDKKIYIHKNLVNKQYLKYDIGYSLDYNNKAILSKVTFANDKPRMLFICNFYSSDWVSHSYIKIKIGNETKQTSAVESRTDVLDGGNIVETNFYTSTSDMLILKWIAENYKKEIMVRFYGKEYYDDITLPMSEKIAIKETYDLYKLLK